MLRGRGYTRGGTRRAAPGRNNPSRRRGDAEVEEGANAVLVVAVALSRAAGSQMTVDYATADGTATAGADYTRPAAR